MSTPNLHPTAELVEYAEGSLGSRARATVASHLMGCASCRTEVKRWEKLLGGLHRLPALAVPTGLSDRITFAVSREAVRRRQAANWLARAATAISWGYAAGMAFFSLGLLGLFVLPGWREGAAKAMAAVSSEAVRLGLGFLDLSAGTWGRLRDLTGDFLQQAEWVSVIGRAFSAALAQPDVQIVLFGGASATLLLVLALIAGGRRKSSRLEVPHAGFLVA